MSNEHTELVLEDPADVAIETTSSTWYHFDKMDLLSLRNAVERAKQDDTTLSMCNLDGVAIVFPWRIVRSLHAANALEQVSADDVEDADDARTWHLLWEREVTTTAEPERVFSEQ